MAINNAVLFNAVLAAASGQNGWLTSSIPSSYDDVRANAEAFATAVDSLIPTSSAIGSAQAGLLQAIAAALLTGRTLQSDSTGDYTAIATSVAAVYTEVAPSLNSSGNTNPSLNPALDQTYYVSKAGNDTTGTGSYSNPFLTIQAALTAIATIGDMSPTKRYVVRVGAGNFDENFNLEPFVYIDGVDWLACRLNPATIGFSANWTPAGDHRAGFSNFTMRGTYTFNFASVSSNEGKLNFENMLFNNRVTLTAFSNINQVVMKNCYYLAGWTQNGINMTTIAGGAQNGAACIMNSLLGINTLNTLLGFNSDGGFQLNHTAGHNNIQAQCVGTNWGGAVALSGTGAIIDPSSTPALWPNGLTTAGGATNPKRTISGAKAGNTALASTITQLVSLGGFLDTTT